MIATAGGGRYFELDRDNDREIANAIIDATRRRAAPGNVEDDARPLLAALLLDCGRFVGLGVLFMRDRASLARCRSRCNCARRVRRYGL